MLRIEYGDADYYALPKEDIEQILKKVKKENKQLRHEENKM